MAHNLSPLSKDQIDNLSSEINGLLKAELEDETKSDVNIRNCDVLPTSESYDKAELLRILRYFEPNSVIFFQDIQKLLQMYLDKNVILFESEEGDYLKEKYFISSDSNLITLQRVAAVFPSLTCNLLKCNKQIGRPISQHVLSDNLDYPRPMTTRCFFSLIPLTPVLGKLKLIEAALLYQVLEQAKFNTIKSENGQVNYSEHMRICVDYCSEDYLTEFEANEKRIQYFDELHLMKHGFPIRPVYDAADKLRQLVGGKWVSEITSKFKLSEND